MLPAPLFQLLSFIVQFSGVAGGLKCKPRYYSRRANTDTLNPRLDESKGHNFQAAVNRDLKLLPPSPRRASHARKESIVATNATFSGKSVDTSARLTGDTLTNVRFHTTSRMEHPRTTGTKKRKTDDRGQETKTR